MFSKKVQEAINNQLNFELYSSYLYLSMSAYYSSIGLNGFANWMRIQSQEELVHAMKFYDYINERGGRVVLQKIQEPQKEWDSAAKAFEAAFEHEQHITQTINDLVNLCIEEKDHASNILLQWYVSEQVEEEASATDILNKLKLTEGTSSGLFMLDNELGQRVFASPVIP